MRKNIIFNSLFLFSIFAYSQPLFCPLSQDALKWTEIKAKNGNDSIISASITTNCLILKEGEWNCYNFRTDISLQKLNNPNIKANLWINNELYTGFLKAKKEENVMTYQFDKGRFERADMEIIPIQNENFLLKMPYIQIPLPQKPEIIYIIDKPVLYLYPTEKQEVSVKINFHNQKIIHPYPAYNYKGMDGWKVIASPNGNLINLATGKSHYCLYWESEGKQLMDKITQGFVVKGTETTAFLEEKLAKMGLNEREANEFIIYWLPKLEQNPYNAIYFATSEYEKAVQLQISPTPQTQIRVMMVWQGLNEKIDLPKQNIPQMPDRKGFTVVEWGGTEISEKIATDNYR